MFIRQLQTLLRILSYQEGNRRSFFKSFPGFPVREVRMWNGFDIREKDGR